MTLPLIAQLCFTRNEFERGLVGLSEEDARRRLPPLNCISWNVGHLAWQEQRCILFGGQRKILFRELDRACAYGAPASEPPLAEMLSAWKAITAAADGWLDTLAPEDLFKPITVTRGLGPYVLGTLIQRIIYHYWYHNGENLAIRQSLGHTNLPEFVGDIDGDAPYQPE